MITKLVKTSSLMCNIIQWLHAHPKKKSFSSSKIFINYLNKHA